MVNGEIGQSEVIRNSTVDSFGMTNHNCVVNDIVLLT